MVLTQLLIIHPGALGDVLQTVPALVGLREFRERTHLTFSGQPRLSRFLLDAGLVDSALSFDGLGLETLFSEDAIPPKVLSRFGRFDRVVSWFGSRDGLFVERLRSIVPQALVAPPVPETGPPPTVWEHLVGTLAPWGVARPAELIPIRVSEGWREEASRALSTLGSAARRPLLVVQPGAGGQDKLWPAENVARVIRRVAREAGCQVLVHQGPADRDAVARLTRELDLPAMVMAEPPLPLLAAVLERADVYLGGDSGVSHLAAAVGAPAIILYPPATRKRWAPWSPTALPLAIPADSESAESVVGLLIEFLARSVTRRILSPGRVRPGAHR